MAFTSDVRSTVPGISWPDIPGRMVENLGLGPMPFENETVHGPRAG